MKTILPLEATDIVTENAIQDRLEKGELITYEKYSELDDRSMALIEKRLEEKSLRLVEVPGDGYQAKKI